MIHLGVNIDHTATLRQARYRQAAHTAGGNIEPDPVALALLADTGVYSHMKLPPLAAPAPVFAAVWAALLVLSGWASYLVIRATRAENLKRFDKSVIWYFVSLAVNFAWPFIFFNLNMYLVASVWSIGYLLLFGWVALKFLKIHKNAGLMMIPQFAWIVYCTYLTIAVFVMSVL